MRTLPVLLLMALATSVMVHALVLLGTDFGALLDASPATTPRLQAALVAPPVRPVPAPALPARVTKPEQPPVEAGSVSPSLPERSVLTDAASPRIAENAPPAPSTAGLHLPDTSAKPPAPPLPEPPQWHLPTAGQLHFAVFKASLGMQVGRAVHRWTFNADGRYELQAVMETSGLVSVFKPVQVTHESRGQLTAQGLQPMQFRILKNGQPTRENADFDWSTAVVHLTRSAQDVPVAPGTQDMLSLIYQLAYLERPEDGSTLGVVSGRKYERHALDSLGEEMVDTPAGRFRTLHLRAAAESLTEIWIALDHARLPVKIRFTDKKGDSYEQLLSELPPEFVTP